MQALTKTCEECKSSSMFWGHVYELLLRERNYEPSMQTVQAVKDAFPEEKPLPWLTKITDFATVVFDSFLQPALSGVRSSARLNRQITVESGALVVDLQDRKSVV